MKKKILIISGGISKERIISLDTGKQVAKELTKNGYIVKITEPDFKLLDVINSFKPTAFNKLPLTLLANDRPMSVITGKPDHKASLHVV